MIVTVNSEITLKSGNNLPVGHKIIAVAIIQQIKGGPLTIISAYPDKEDDFILSWEDVEKVSIVPETFNAEERPQVEAYVKAAKTVNEIIK